jgi:hypothetical protein
VERVRDGSNIVKARVASVASGVRREWWKKIAKK